MSTPGYGCAAESLFKMCVGNGIGEMCIRDRLMVALSWFARSWEPAWISYVTLGSSYVLIILAFYLDFSKIRRCV